MTTISQDSPVSKGSEQDGQLIVQAAISLFLKQGFPLTTMEDIAQSAGMPVEVVCRYFPGKYDILRMLGSMNKAAATGMLKELLAAGPLPDAGEIIGRVADFFEGMVQAGGPAGIAPQAMGLALYDPEVDEIIQDVMDGLRSGWLDVAARLGEEGRLPEGTDSKEVGMMLFTLAIGFMSQSLLVGAKASDMRHGLGALIH